MRTPALLILLGACTATPTSPTGSTPSDSGSHSAVEWGHSDAATTHSAYVVPDLPPPTPGPLEYGYPLARVEGYALLEVFSGPGEWDQFVADEWAAGCPHYLDDPPCRPLPDAAELGMSDATPWLAFSPDRYGTAWDMEAVVRTDSVVDVRWAFCGNADNLALDAAFFPIPRAAYAGANRITEPAKDECDR